MNLCEIPFKQRSSAFEADWKNPFWQSIEPVSIDFAHPASSAHLPKTQVKAAYNEHSIHILFRVQDQYIRALATETHGPVYKDSCVEFFFAPNPQTPDSYFNLEINCCGTLLAQHHTGPRKNSRYLDIRDCQKIQVAGSLNRPIHREITEPLTWTLEIALPFEILTPYAPFEKPAPGVIWRANFYKCADESSHPHWLMWSPVITETPDFHRPDYFGRIEFL